MQKIYGWMLVVALALPGVAAASDGSVVGRLLLEGPGAPASPGRVRVELRQGWEVLEAEVGPDGRFQASGPAGDWRLDYLTVGGRVQFLEGQTLEIPGSGTTCAGTLTVRLPEERAPARAAPVRVEADCPGNPAPRRAAAPAGPLFSDPPYSLLRRLGDLRIVAAPEGGVAYRLVVHDAQDLNLFVMPMVLFPDILSLDLERRAFSVTAGVDLWEMIEISGGYVVDPGAGAGIGTVPVGILRYGGPAVGILGIARLGGPEGNAFHLGVDLSPVAFIGSLL